MGGNLIICDYLKWSLLAPCGRDRARGFSFTLTFSLSH
jgi:hypothetical protein